MKNDMPKLARKLSKAYGCSVRIVGPYKCKDGRKRIDVRGAPQRSGLNKTIQLARARLEVLLGRPLRKGETVDHVDNDASNDSYDNVQLLSHARNAGKQTRATRRKIVKTLRSKAARLSNSLRNRGEKNSAAKLSDKQAKRIRKEFDRNRDLESLLEVVPFGAHSLLNCLRGWTYVSAGGPRFVFAPRSKGCKKKPLRVVQVLR
jgi:hypothetical protein